MQKWTKKISIAMSLAAILISICTLCKDQIEEKIDDRKRKKEEFKEILHSAQVYAKKEVATIDFASYFATYPKFPESLAEADSAHYAKSLREYLDMTGWPYTINDDLVYCTLFTEYVEALIKLHISRVPMTPQLKDDIIKKIFEKAHCEAKANVATYAIDSTTYAKISTMFSDSLNTGQMLMYDLSSSGANVGDSWVQSSYDLYVSALETGEIAKATKIANRCNGN